MLTEHQRQKEEEALDILSKGNRVLIKGSAGVGKTFMLNSLLSNLKKKLPSYLKVNCSAPTNKAVAVLKDKIPDQDNAEFLTLHQALKYKRRVDRHTGEVTFEPSFDDRNAPFKGVSLVVVDESSMVGRDLHMNLEKYSGIKGVKVVYVGDHKQLNPVGEEISPVFMGTPQMANDEPLKEGQVLVDDTLYTQYPTVELTEIVRQGEGNPIIDLSRNLKEIWNYEDNLTTGNLGYIHSRDKARVIETLAAVNGSDELKYLGYTNRDVDALNTDVRNRIYGNPRKVEPGESIVFNSPYKDQFFTSQELKVHTVEVLEQDFTIPYNQGVDRTRLKVYLLNGKEMEGGKAGIYVVHEQDERKLRTLAMTTKRACESRNMSWIARDQFLSQFADIKYNHALTVHKSQGSTYQQVILNVPNLSLNKDANERERLFYTAVTRASKLLVLYHG